MALSGLRENVILIKLYLLVDNFSIMSREVLSTARITKEAMFIRVNDPSLQQEPKQIPAAPHPR